MPLAAVGLPPGGHPVASAICTVGIQECCGSGRVGEEPKVCSATGVLEGSLQAARGSTSTPAKMPSNSRLRMMAPCKSALQCAGPADVHGFCYELRVIKNRAEATLHGVVFDISVGSPVGLAARKASTRGTGIWEAAMNENTDA